MKPSSSLLSSLLLLVLLFSCALVSTTKITPKLATFLKSQHQFSNKRNANDDAAKEYRIWIFFTDKSGKKLTTKRQDDSHFVSLQKKRIFDALDKSAIQRRAIANEITTDLSAISTEALADAVVDETDLPVYEEYVSQIIKTLNSLQRSATPASQRIWARSAWLNAISVKNVLLPEAEAISQLPFVASIEKVASFTKPAAESSSSSSSLSNAMESMTSLMGDAGLRSTQLFVENITTPLNYGRTNLHVNQIEVPAIHNSGYFGQGVKLLVMDSGFRLAHPVFSHVSVIDKYDFVNNDPNVDFEQGDAADEINHGSKCLGQMVGYIPGQYVGVAPLAKVLLAKTENTKSESSVEEDNLVRALEWGEQRGAQVASMSLGYSDWYTSSDYDGKTCISTKGVNAAIKKGMTCVVAAGNSGPAGISAPADAPYAITVGAVDNDGRIGGFSSVGPTADGRVKPEVCARGVVLELIEPSGTGYTSASGTSFATPLVAAVVTLMYSANPNLKPLKVRDIIIRSAKPSAYTGTIPNNSYGWGILNATNAWKLSFTADSDLNCGANNSCSGNGICKDGACECYTHAYGSTCEFQKTVCSSESCINGICKDNVCKCFQGYSGIMCESSAAAQHAGSLLVSTLLLLIVVSFLMFN